MGIQYSCINKSSCLAFSWALSALPVQFSMPGCLPPFSCRSSQAEWSWHVRKISAPSWGDWRIGNTMTCQLQVIYITCITTFESYLNLPEFTSIFMNLPEWYNLGSLGYTWVHLGWSGLIWLDFGVLGEKWVTLEAQEMLRHTDTHRQTEDFSNALRSYRI